MLPVFRLSTDFHPLNCKFNHFPERRARDNPAEVLFSAPPGSFLKTIQSKNVLSAFMFTYERLTCRLKCSPDPLIPTFYFGLKVIEGTAAQF